MSAFGDSAPPSRTAAPSSGITWVVKTTTYSAVTGDHILADTSSAGFTITLPGSPAAGDNVSFGDYSGTWDTANLTIARNGNNIESAAANLTCDVEWAIFDLVYFDATVGWKVVLTEGMPGPKGPGSISLSGQSTGTSTVYGSSGVVLSGQNVTLAGNQNTLSFNGPQISFLELFPAGAGATGTMLFGADTMLVLPFDVPQELVFSRLNLFASMSVAGSSFAASAAGSQTTSFSGSQALKVVIWSQGTGASSSALFSMSSTQWTISAQQSISESSDSFTASNTLAFATAITAAGAYGTLTTSWTATTNATAGQTNLFTSLSDSFSGWRQIYFPMPNTLSAGHYWLGAQRGTAGTSGLGIQFSNMFLSMSSQLSWGYPGADTNSSIGPMGFAAGQSSLTFSTAIPASMALSDVTFIASAPYGNFMNFAL
jgi:hypothetical protein